MNMIGREVDIRKGISGARPEAQVERAWRTGPFVDRADVGGLHGASREKNIDVSMYLTRQW